MLTATSISSQLKQAMGSSVTVRARRPNIFQVEVPAHLGDGDVAMLFVQPQEDGRFRMTDLGHTRMRLSYRRPLTAAIDATLAGLARVHGLELDQGEISAMLEPDTLAAGALGLLQVQSEADVTVAASLERGERAESFKRSVIDALKAAFASACEVGFHDAATDPEGIYSLDAVIHGSIDLGISVVPTDIDAERAVANKLHLAPHMTGKPRWVAIPRDIDQLGARTRRRLMEEHLVPIPSWDRGRERMKAELLDLAR